jgi:5-methylcytosine-specific restriction endonuclease McrA
MISQRREENEMRLKDFDSVEAYINTLIRKDRVKEFYSSAAWLNLRQQVIKEAHFECQICKGKGEVVADIGERDADGRKKRVLSVHHIQELRKRPDLALTKSNLICICDDCHFKIHHPSHRKKWDDEMF